jgi:hypothetical protein
VKTAKQAADVVRAYLAAIQQVIDDIRIYPRNQRYYLFDAVTFGLLSKVFSVADAVTVLVEHQHPEEAFGLCRTLVECTLNLRFLTRERIHNEKRAQLFALHYFDEAGFWLHQMLEFYAGNSKMLAKLKANALQHNIAATPNKPRHWSGVKDFTWSVAVEQHPCDGKVFKRSHRQAEYEVDYFRTSAYVHGSHGSIETFYPANGAAFTPRHHSTDIATGQVACSIVLHNVQQAVLYTLYGAQVLRPNVDDELNTALSKPFRDGQKQLR